RAPRRRDERDAADRRPSAARTRSREFFGGDRAGRKRAPYRGSYTGCSSNTWTSSTSATAEVFWIRTPRVNAGGWPRTGVNVANSPHVMPPNPLVIVTLVKSVAWRAPLNALTLSSLFAATVPVPENRGTSFNC